MRRSSESLWWGPAMMGFRLLDFGEDGVAKNHRKAMNTKQILSCYPKESLNPQQGFGPPPSKPLRTQNLRRGPRDATAKPGKPRKPENRENREN